MEGPDAEALNGQQPPPAYDDVLGTEGDGSVPTNGVTTSEQTGREPAPAQSEQTAQDQAGEHVTVSEKAGDPETAPTQTSEQDVKASSPPSSPRSVANGAGLRRNSYDNALRKDGKLSGAGET